MLEELMRRGNEIGMMMLPASIIFWACWSAWQWVSNRWMS